MPQILIAGTVPVISVIRIIQPPFRALPVQQMVPSHDWLSVQYSEMLGSFSGTKTCRIRRLCHVPTACKRNAYLALVRPLLEYGAPVWDPHQKQDIDRMERVQRTAVRFISRDYRSRTPGFVASLLTKHNLPTLQERREHLRLGLYYKVVEGLVPAIPPHKFLTPQKAGRMIRPRHSTADYITQNPVENYIRNNDRCFVVPHCHTEQYKQSFFPRTTIAWNQLDNSVVHSSSTETFKTALLSTKRR